MVPIIGTRKPYVGREAELPKCRYQAELGNES